MSKQKSKPLQPAPEPEPEPLLPPVKPEQKKPQVPTFTEIGSSPVPGLTLRHVLRGHTDTINRIAWSPDGRFLASPSHDKTIRIWDVETGECLSVLNGDRMIIGVVWSPNSKNLISYGKENSIIGWDR